MAVDEKQNGEDVMEEGLWARCDITSQRSYASCAFVAVARNGDDEEVMRSPAFRWRKGNEGPVEAPDAVASLAALEEALLVEGWERIDDPRDQWYSLRFRRPAIPLADRIAAYHADGTLMAFVEVEAGDEPEEPGPAAVERVPDLEGLGSAKPKQRSRAEPTESERLEAARLEAERLEAERLEAERASAARLEAERLESARLEAERERLEAQRLEAERLEAERLEAERVESERREAERLESERLELARLEASGSGALEAERLEAERVESERREAERLEFERLELARLEAERERLEAERLEAERVESERLEAEWLEFERLELARLEAERERLEAERLEAERLEAERLEAERLEAERLEAERLAAQESPLHSLISSYTAELDRNLDVRRIYGGESAQFDPDRFTRRFRRRRR